LPPPHLGAPPLLVPFTSSLCHATMTWPLVVSVFFIKVLPAPRKVVLFIGVKSRHLRCFWPFICPGALPCPPIRFPCIPCGLPLLLSPSLPRFIRKLFLWPRFHEVVRQQLAHGRPEVVELKQPMTPRMVSMQESILAAMKACLEDLRR
jgi:hypothetical protein